MKPNCQDFIVFEGIVSISAIINAKSRKIYELWINDEYKHKKDKQIAFLLAKSKELSFPVHFTSLNDITPYCAGNTHGGIIAFCEKKEIPPFLSNDLENSQFAVYLDGIEDPYNFGFTIRSLYCAGVDTVLLTKRNWMDAAGIVSKSSAGTSEKIKMRVIVDESFIDQYKNNHFLVTAANIRDSESVFDCDKLKYPILLLIGGEKRGLSAKMLAKVDLNLRIDYAIDFKGSLPTATASSIIAFEIFNKNKKRGN